MYVTTTMIFYDISSQKVRTSHAIRDMKYSIAWCGVTCHGVAWHHGVSVLRDMIDVRNGFKTCAYYTNNDVEDVINDICLNWNVKLTMFF